MAIGAITLNAEVRDVSQKLILDGENHTSILSVPGFRASSVCLSTNIAVISDYANFKSIDLAHSLLWRYPQTELGGGKGDGRSWANGKPGVGGVGRSPGGFPCGILLGVTGRSLCINLVPTLWPFDPPSSRAAWLHLNHNVRVFSSGNL